MKLRLLSGAVRFRPGGSARLSAQPLRRVSDSPGPGAPLRRWAVAVSPFTRLQCHLPCDVTVRPLDPLSFPGADRAFIDLHGPPGSGEGPDVRVHYDEQSRELRVQLDQTSRGVSVEVTAPIKSDLQVVTRGTGSVKIQGMESDLCQVQTENGHCVLHSIKSHRVRVQSSGGNITGMGTIHGDVEISAAGGSSVDVKKIQGTTMTVSTEQGPLKVKAIYAESTSVASSSGNVHIGHLHGEAHVQNNTGDIIIDSSSGALTAFTKAGNIDVYVGQTGTAVLQTQQGDARVRVPATMKAGVQLCGTTVDISSEIAQETERHSAEGKTVVLGQLNGGGQEDCWIKATADRGAVSLKTQSWFETLRLGS